MYELAGYYGYDSSSALQLLILFVITWTVIVHNRY